MIFGSYLDWGLTAYYSLDIDGRDDISRYMDLSPGTGTPQPVPVTGKIRNGHYFNGGSFAFDPDRVGEMGYFPWTVSCWCYRSSSSPWGACEYLIKGYSDDYVDIRFINGRPSIYNPAADPPLEIITSGSLSYNTWHHLFFLLDGGLGTGYISVDLDQEGPGSADGFLNWPTLFPLELGKDLFGTTLDEIGIWGLALAAGSSTVLYNEGAGLPYISAISDNEILKHRFTVKCVKEDMLGHRFSIPGSTDDSFGHKFAVAPIPRFMGNNIQGQSVLLDKFSPRYVPPYIPKKH